MVMHKDPNPDTPEPKPLQQPLPNHSMEFNDIFPTDMQELNTPKNPTQLTAITIAFAVAVAVAVAGAVAVAVAGAVAVAVSVAVAAAP